MHKQLFPSATTARNSSSSFNTLRLQRPCPWPGFAETPVGKVLASRPPTSISRAVVQPLSLARGYFSAPDPSRHCHAPNSDGLLGSWGPNSGLHGLQRIQLFAKDSSAAGLLVLCSELFGCGAVRGIREAGAQQGAVEQLRARAALWQPGFAVSARFSLPLGASSSFSTANKAAF